MTKRTSKPAKAQRSTNWGGARPGAGAKPKTEKPKAASREIALAAASPAPSRAMLNAFSTAIEASNAHARTKARRPEINPFQLPAFPPGSTPPKKLRMAMDDSMGWAGTQWAGGVLGSIGAEGLMFLGYPYLAELAQRPEYRVISETIATEMTRKWIKFSSTGAAKAKKTGEDNPDSDKTDNEKTEKIKQLTDFLDHLQVRDNFADLAAQDGFFGRSHLFLDDGKEGTNDAELKTPIGDGRDKLATAKIGRDWLKAVRTVEAVWAYPTTYNATNPLKPDWYNPQVWYVMGKEIHKSRLLTFIGRPVPDLLKPAYSFGGLSLSQMAQPYVNIWLQTRESIAALIHSFSVMVLMTDLQTILQPNNAGGLIARANLFNALRDNQGLMVVNKATEDFKNVSASLSGLHELQAQAQEHMASVARIPLVKFTGISPAGLNASSEGEMRAFYDTIAAYQNKFFRPNLNTLVSIAQVSLWGAADPDIVYEFVPLWELNEKENGEKRKAEAETAQIDVDMGAISPAERRAVIIADPESPYQGLDPDDLPDLDAEEEAGLEPEGGRPDPKAGGEPSGGEGGGPAPGKGGERGGEDSAAVIPFSERVDPLFAGDADFQEADHPRAPDGKFGSGSGSGGASGPSNAEKIKNAATMYGAGSSQHKQAIKRFSESETKKDKKPKGPAKAGSAAALNPADLKRVGNQMGSNPGGVFEDASGKKFYIKQPQSKAHVRNELLAGRLYALAGAPTLNYRPVAGGGHVATELVPLDKNRASKLSPAEVKEAQKDFAVHAWLGNYDAVGMGGDNLGTVNGVPTALDLGGALAYRAQGAPKGDKFGTSVGELDSMRDPAIAPDASKIFGQMTPAQMKESASKVTSIRDGAIRAAVKAAGEGEEMADKLIARKADIAKRFGLTMDEAAFNEADHPRANNGQFGSGGGGAVAGKGPKKDGETERQKFRMPQYGLNSPPSHFTSFKEWKRAPSPMPTSTGNHDHADSVVVFNEGTTDAPKSLNGTKFEAWTPPTDLAGWAKVSGQDAKDEPPIPELRKGMELSSGVIIMEPDGRVWLMRPKGGYGGYDQTFPKGHVEDGLSLQANAIKEAYEETGIKAKILGHVGDYEGDVTVTRFYVAERETGDPSQHGEETEAVVLSPPDQLKKFLNRKRDKEIAALIGDEASFEEGKHPRGPDGKFSSTGGGGSAELQDVVKEMESLNDVAEKELSEYYGSVEKAWDALTETAPGMSELKPEVIAKGITDAVAYTSHAEGVEQFMKGFVQKALMEPDNKIGGELENLKIENQVPAKPKKTAFGGLWKDGGADDKQNLVMNISHVLSKPTNSGSSYRQMLAHMIKKAEENPDVANKFTVDDLKTKLKDAYVKASEKLAVEALSEPDNAKMKALSDKSMKALEKAKELGWKSSTEQTKADVVKQATKQQPIAGYSHKDSPLEINVYLNSDGKKFNVVVNDKETGEILPTSYVVSSPQEAAEKAAQILTGKDTKKEKPTGKPDAPKIAPPPATAVELEKAKKNVKLQMQYVPGAPAGNPDAQKLVDAFNQKYEGKALSKKADLEEKVADFKKMQDAMIPLMSAEQQKQAEAQKNAAAEEAKKQASAAAKAKKEKLKHAEALKEVMTKLGVADPNDAEAFEGFIELAGGNKEQLLAQFKKFEEQGSHQGLPISPFEYAMLQSYTGSSYASVNSSLRQGAVSMKQHVYVNAVNKALKKMPPYTKTTKRGTSLPTNVQALYQVGHVVEERAFTSTSKTKPWGGNTQYVISGKSGRDVSGLSLHGGEKEVLYPARTFFKVTKVQGKPGSTMTVHLEEVDAW